MSKSFYPEKTNHLEEPMFFGNGVNLARYDSVKYPIFEKLTESQLGFFWRPEEVDISKDQKDYAGLSEREKRIFTLNLQFQIVLDTVQGRSPNLAMLPWVSLPEVETWIETWSFSETIHSRSYTHIIRNILPDPAVLFDAILDDEMIQRRAKQVTYYYDSLLEYSELMLAHGEGRHEINGVTIFLSTFELKRRFYLMMVSINILEGISFYVSFACSWAFAENRKLIGNADIISLIARDENLHLSGTQHMLKLMAKEDDDFAMIAEQCKHEMLEMYREAVASEKEWADYLFKDGAMLGVNSRILHKFVEYICDIRTNAIGLGKLYNTKNPMEWINKWLNTGLVQAAPQEKEINKYLVGIYTPDDSDLSNFL